MNKYYLTRTPKGTKFLYEIKERESGKVVAKRLSKRDNYVAATSNGEFFFGRLDLIGKGLHGKIVNRCKEILTNPESVYEKLVKEYIPSYRATFRKEYPYELWVSQFGGEYAQKRFNELNEIAYL